MVRQGVAAIIGPQSEASADHVQSMCQNMRIPHIQTHWDPKHSSALDIMKSGSRYSEINNSPLSINLYPHPASISKVIFKYRRCCTVMHISDFSSR